MTLTEVWLVRHGQTEWNRAGRAQGALDSPLTELGIEQGRAAGRRLEAEPIDTLFVSPLGRARHTARLIGESVPAPVVVLPALAELDHGELGGLTQAEMLAQHPEQARRRAADRYRYRYPRGESYADVDARAEAALAEVAAHGVARAALVSHGMIGRMLLRHLLGETVEQAFTRRQDNDVIFVVDPVARRLRELA